MEDMKKIGRPLTLEQLREMVEADREGMELYPPNIRCYCKEEGRGT